MSYDVRMRTVTVADLKNNLSRYLREVRQGQRYTVLSRDVPVARLLPLENAGRILEVRAPKQGARPPGRVSLPPPLPTPLDTGDIVGLLLEERGDR